MKNQANGNHLEICLSFSQKNGNSHTWVLGALIVCFTYPVLLASLGSTGKNGNSLACLRNAGFHSAVTYCMPAASGDDADAVEDQMHQACTLSGIASLRKLGYSQLAQARSWHTP